MAVALESIVGPSQADLLATTLTDVYTVSSLMAVVSSIVVCNRNAGSIKYRLSIAVGGVADAAKQYIAYDVVLAGNTSDAWTIGVTLAQNDVVRAYSDTANAPANSGNAANPRTRTSSRS